MLPTAYLRNTGAQTAEAGVGQVVEGTSEQWKFASVHFFSRVGFEHNVPNARVANSLVLASVHRHLREDESREDVMLTGPTSVHTSKYFMFCTIITTTFAVGSNG